MNSMTPRELALWQSSDMPFTLLDVRRAAVHRMSGQEIAGAQWRDPAQWLDWKDQVPTDRPVVFYCAHGHEISQGLAAALRAMGADARSLSGGFEAWCQAAFPTAPISS